MFSWEAMEADDNSRLKKKEGIRQIHGKYIHRQILKGIGMDISSNILNPTIVGTGKA